jgi:hypothetical protein
MPETTKSFSITGLSQFVYYALGKAFTDLKVAPDLKVGDLKVQSCDFSCFNDSMTKERFADAVRRIIEATSLPYDTTNVYVFLDREVVDQKSAADLVIAVAQAIACFAGDESKHLSTAIKYIMEHLHDFLDDESAEAPPFHLYRLAGRSEAAMRLLRPGMSQDDLDHAIQTAKEVDADTRATLGNQAFSFFPKTLMQVELLRPSEDGNELSLSPEEQHEAVRLLKKKNGLDECWQRTDDEVNELIGEARQIVSQRNEARMPVEAAVRQFLIASSGCPRTRRSCSSTAPRRPPTGE